MCQLSIQFKLAVDIKEKPKILVYMKGKYTSSAFTFFTSFLAKSISVAWPWNLAMGYKLDQQTLRVMLELD